MQENSTNKQDLIIKMCDLAFDNDVDGKTFYYMLEAIMEMFKSL